MKVASDKLLHYLTPSKLNVTSSSISFGKRGKFFWDQGIYNTHRLSYKHNNYALLCSGLLICYSSWINDTEYVPYNMKNFILLGEGVFHGGVIEDVYYNPPAEAYE